MSRWLSPVWLLPVAALWTACTPPAPQPPRAEFIIATPDSAFWVRSGVEGVRVRAVPMALANYGGRYHEVYVSDVDRSFSDAVITGERMYTRDILTGDSTLVYDDTAALALALDHARSTPDARPLSPDDETPDDPDLTATGETDILDVRGPYVLFEHRFSVDTGTDDGNGDVGAGGDTVRGAIDLQTGKAVPPGAVLMIARDSSVVLTLPRTWRRAGYELVARHDAARGGVAFGLRDMLHHAWRVATTGKFPHVYWLDTPPVDAQTRRALMHAFNSAATYDEAVKYVRDVAPGRTSHFGSRGGPPVDGRVTATATPVRDAHRGRGIPLTHRAASAARTHQGQSGASPRAFHDVAPPHLTSLAHLSHIRRPTFSMPFILSHRR